MNTALIKKLVDVRRALDLIAIICAGYFSELLVTGFTKPDRFESSFGGWALIEFCFILPVALRERSWRNVSAYEAMAFSKMITVFSVINLLIAGFWTKSPTLLAWIVVNSLTVLAFLCGMRLVRRIAFEFVSKRSNQESKKNVLIYGVGRAAQGLIAQLSSGVAGAINVVGLIDDDLDQVGRIDKGIRVLGISKNLPELFRRYGVDELIIAKRPSDGAVLHQMLQEAQRFKVQTRILAETRIDGGGSASVGRLREINLQDLLQRPRVQVDLESTRVMTTGKTVLVSGAGGSIGSELVRQIISMAPEQVVALDHSELNLYEIDVEVKRSAFKGKFVPILSDLKEGKILSKIFADYRPNIIYHAAAYKHVHLVEANPNAAIINNLFTFKNLLECAVKFDVGSLVLISSDKAVSPKGIMGYTKRACEILVTQVANHHGRRYCSVRFGNVLGSSGSFILLLKKQIEEGGPVTITHPDMERYFMLIPEAVSLVLKAASISAPGDINVLRMGNSIKIIDIARTLITLMGKPVESVPIIFTEVRPGEKLREELYLRGDEMSTDHPDILVLPRGGQELIGGRAEFTSALIGKIIEMARNDDPRASDLLRSMVEMNEFETDFARKELGNEPSQSLQSWVADNISVA